MKIIIGYSTDPVTVTLLRNAGIEAYTCDIRSADHPWHIQDDIWNVAIDNWSGGLFHPMCSYLTCTASWAFSNPNFTKYPGVGYHQKLKPGTPTGMERRVLRHKALENFRRIMALPYPKAIENPALSFASSMVRPPDQIIQPYQFGDDASKRTGLWLDGIPRLKPTKRIRGRIVEWPPGSGKNFERWENQLDSGNNRLEPGEDRWLDRSYTYPGIASAMAQQWWIK